MTTTSLTTAMPDTAPRSPAPPADAAAPGDDLSSRGLMPGWLGVPVRAWAMTGVLAVLFVALYWSSLRRLWLKTNPIDGVAEWAHAVFVPLIGVYYLFLHLDELKAAKVRPLLGGDLASRPRWIGAAAIGLFGTILYFAAPHLPGPLSLLSGELGYAGLGLMGLAAFVALFDWGVGTLLFGLAVFAFGIHPGRNDFIKDVGMVVSLFGAVLTIGGWGIMRIAWFPVLFLLCALPWPGLFYSKVAMPLQELAAQIGVFVMRVCGVDAAHYGTIMKINFPLIPGQPQRPAYPLEVAEACAGLKSLMTFVSLGAAMAFLAPRPLWHRLLVTASAVPIAIGCNVMRVAVQGLLVYYVSEKTAEGFVHQFAGLVMLIPGFFLLLGVIWVLDRLVIEEDDTPSVSARAAETTASVTRSVSRPATTTTTNNGGGAA